MDRQGRRAAPQTLQRAIAAPAENTAAKQTGRAVLQLREATVLQTARTGDSQRSQTDSNRSLQERALAAARARGTGSECEPDLAGARGAGRAALPDHSGCDQPSPETAIATRSLPFY